MKHLLNIATLTIFLFSSVLIAGTHAKYTSTSGNIDLYFNSETIIAIRDNHKTIFDFQNNKVYRIDNKSKKYYSSSFDQFQEKTELGKKKLEKIIDEEVSKLEESENENDKIKAKKIKEIDFSQVEDFLSFKEYTVKKENTSEQGFECDRMHLEDGTDILRIAWMAVPAEIDLKNSDFSVFKKIDSKSIATRMFLFQDYLDLIQHYDKFPVKIKDYKQSKFIYLTELKDITIDSKLKEIPDDYQHIESPFQNN